MGTKIDTVDSILIKGKNLVFTMNDGTLWEKEITSRNRIDCIDKEVRDFHDGNEFLKIGSRMVRGSIVKRLIPVFEYSKIQYGEKFHEYLCAATLTDPL